MKKDNYDFNDIFIVLILWIASAAGLISLILYIVQEIAERG